MCFALCRRKGRSRLRPFGRDEETEGGGVAAAIARCDGELAGFDDLREELLDAAAAQAGLPLQRGLIDAPLAVLGGVVGDDNEEEERGAPLLRAFEDGGDMLMTQRTSPPGPDPVDPKPSPLAPLLRERGDPHPLAPSPTRTHGPREKGERRRAGGAHGRAPRRRGARSRSTRPDPWLCQTRTGRNGRREFRGGP